MTEIPFKDRAPLAIDDCGLGQVAQILGDKWCLLIIRELFYSVGRFEDIRRDIEIPKAVLSSRLKQLLTLGILEKQPYQLPGERQRYGYTLTASGRALFPLIVAATQWGDRYLRENRASFTLVHRNTGAPVDQGFICDGAKTSAQEIAVKLPDGTLL